METERVCFRVENDEYSGRKNILACYPDDPANIGRLCFVCLWYDIYGTMHIGTHDEMDIQYYWNNTKPLKDDKLAYDCARRLEAYYKTKDYDPHFHIVKRIVRR